MAVLQKAILLWRTGTYQRFYDANQIYMSGEATLITSGQHKNRVKVGDGVTAWRNLDWTLGTAATIQIGSVELIPYGESPVISNSGTINEAVFNFKIPEGKPGEDGIDGANGLTMPDPASLNTASLIYGADELLFVEQQNNTGALEKISVMSLSETIKMYTLLFIYGVGSVVKQFPNEKSPLQKYWGMYWSVGNPIDPNVLSYWERCEGRAIYYRLTDEAIPAYTVYTAGSNYTTGQVVLYQIDQDSDKVLYKANVNITNAPQLLNYTQWTEINKNDNYIEQIQAHPITSNDLNIGDSLGVMGYIEAVFTYSGKIERIENLSNPALSNINNNVINTSAAGPSNTGQLARFMSVSLWRRVQ